MSKLIKHQYSKNSLQNFMTVMLYITGLFILYRYIKTIAKDSKIIQNYVIELESRVTTIEKHQNTINIQELAKKQSIALNETEVDNFDNDLDDEIEKDEDEDEDEDEEDNESIGSEDITNLLKKVMLGTADIHEDEDEDDVIEEIEVEIVDSMKTETCDVDEPKVTSNEVEPTVDPEDITISYKSDYKKMTLPELRKLLKEKNLVSKGTKSELIDRLANC